MFYGKQNAFDFNGDSLLERTEWYTDEVGEIESGREIAE